MTGFAGIGVRQEHDEVIPSPAGDNITGTADPAKHCGYLLQQHIANTMTEHIVGKLQSVYIASNDKNGQIAQSHPGGAAPAQKPCGPLASVNES